MAEQIDVVAACRLAEKTGQQVVVHGIFGHALDGTPMSGTVTVTPSNPTSTEVIIVDGIGESLGT